MIVDGKAIAQDISVEVKKLLRDLAGPPCLTVFVCAPTKETKKFLELKTNKAKEIGVDVVTVEFDPGAQTAEVVTAIEAAIPKSEGIIVQLPFPGHINVEEVLAAVPQKLDVDALRYTGRDAGVLPPVVGAIAALATKYEVNFKNKKIAVIGRGRLVGQPAALWAKAQGGEVVVLDKDTPDVDVVLKTADIIISGAGRPGLLTPEKIKDRVIIFDAGTSEEGGELRGDADPSCAGKSSLFTPVPGGIGPITIAVLFRNLVTLAGR